MNTEVPVGSRLLRTEIEKKLGKTLGESEPRLEVPLEEETIEKLPGRSNYYAVMPDLRVVPITATATNSCEFEFGLGDRIQLKTGTGGSGTVRDGQCEIAGQVLRIIYLVEDDNGLFYLARQEEIKPEGG